ICRSLPADLRSELAGRLAASFEPSALKDIDTSKVDSDPVFQALHFSWYNRHCT
ncbi:hypothetical protein FOMPIDRAFT_1087424, partial [Fomitopsis schrenkii]